jgi:DNA-binding winged helix-turn-helix (wHTH) protein
MEDKVRVLTFGPFRLLPSQGQLWKEEERLEVRLRPLAVLTYLAQHPEQVVSIEEMRKAIWGSTYVSRTVIRVCIRELRRALGDEAATPHYIETVGRQGYRFIAPLATSPLASSSKFQVPSSKTVPTPSPQSPTPHFVGRERELAQLQEWFAQAQQGQRQLVFVSGDPGIGKTTLIEVFLFGVRSHEKFGVHSPKPRTLNPELPSTPSPWIGHG